jgi:hypothetical protein
MKHINDLEVEDMQSAPDCHPLKATAPDIWSSWTREALFIYFL